MAVKRAKTKPFWIYFAIAFITFIISLILSITLFMNKIEWGLRDNLFEVRGPIPVEDSPIVMVAISETADGEIPEKWPWPTNVHAKLVENLNRAGAKVILFDVLFSQQDQYDPANDTLFAQAINKYGNVILAGDVERQSIAQRDDFNPIFPINILRSSNPNEVGFVRTYPYPDGYVRTYNFGIEHLEGLYFMLGLEGVRLYEGISYSEIDSPKGETESGYFQLGKHRIDCFFDNSFYINFYGPEETFPTISYDQVIDDTSYTTNMEREAFDMNLFEDPATGQGLLYDEVFKDKIVIVGATMPTLQDFHPTPFASSDIPRPGFEIHAHAIQTILDDNYITRQNDWIRLIIMLVAVFGVVFFNRRFGASWGFVCMIVLMAGYYFYAVQMFLQVQMFVHISSVLLALFVAQIGTVGYEYVHEQKEKKRIKGMFSSYVSPQLVNQMVESGEEPQLGGEDTYMTAFFSDIVSFSSFSEKLEPKELVTLINEYLTAMTDIINDQGGTLDKFIGDAIVAFFGAPVMVEDHALRACITSQLMNKKLAELREKWSTEDWPEIVWNMHHRMGMNTGDMVTGNMGSERRFNYTMMGDNVNLAARCESGAKQYHVYTMVTEATKVEAEKYGDDCVFRLLDNIVVKGRTKPVKVYEIADLRKDATPELLECISLYESGMECYFNQNWDKAISYFENSLNLERYADNPSQLFIERCKAMKANPPAKDWDGVFVMMSK